MTARGRILIMTAILGLIALCSCTVETRIGEAEERIVEASVADLRSMMESGELTSEAMVKGYLARIERLDGTLNAIVAVNPEAVEQAAALDREREDGNVRGPLHGIPVILKDNIESMDAMATTAGSLALAQNVTGRDAFLVRRLREAGAVILGKANLSEWANFRSERSSSGWSAVGGQTRNPYDPTRSPCGSSSGSAVAVAANFAPVAVGTETNGSVVCPSTVNGLVGIKPSLGLVSRTGIVPISHSQDTAGPMARTVADAVFLLETMIGVDDQDPVTEYGAQLEDRDLAAHLKADGLEGKRIGVVRSLTGYHDGVDRLLDRAIEDLKAGGAEIVDDLAFEPPNGFSGMTYDLLLYEFKHDLNAYLATLPDETLSTLTLESLIAFNEAHAELEMPWFGQEIFVKSQEKGPLTEQAYLDALAGVQFATKAEGIDRLIVRKELDALIAPSGSPAWKIDLIDGDHFLGSCSTYPAVSGYPHITVPMGQVHGMPVGISFFGTYLSEPTLVEIAYAYERRTQRRVPPEL